MKTIYPAWDGGAVDVSAWESVTIWCTTAPATPWAIKAGPAANAMVDQSAVANTATGFSTTTSIAAVGRYTLSAGCIVQLTGGAGGAFQLIVGG